MKKLYRLVIDTNVIISALRSKQGASYKLMYQIVRSDLELYLSVPLVFEYEKVAIDHLGVIPFSLAEVNKYIDFLCQIAKKRKIHYLWRPFLKDSKDDMVLELAVEGSCKYIVTFNKKDFQGSEKFGVTVLTPKEFLNLIGE